MLVVNPKAEVLFKMHSMHRQKWQKKYFNMCAGLGEYQLSISWCWKQQQLRSV